MGVTRNNDTKPKSVPDIDATFTNSWIKRSFPIQGTGKRNVVQVIIKRSVLDAIRQHGLSRTDVEICGVLVGNCYQDERGPFVYVEAMVRGEHSQNQAAQVTFTGETWNHIQSEMDLRFSDKRMLGWYHTHPGFGIFLSPMDLFIHDNFFNSSEQLALVYDPLRHEDGLFVWHDGKAVLHQYLVEEDTATARQTDSKNFEKTPKMAMTAAANYSSHKDLESRLKRIERRQVVLFVAVTVLGLLATVWAWLFSRLILPSEASESSPSKSDDRSNSTVLPNEATKLPTSLDNDKRIEGEFRQPRPENDADDRDSDSIRFSPDGEIQRSP